mgnify:CR=1 FL=1
MSLRYRVGDFWVDLSRNQITLNEQVQTIPPKALAVLTYLAKHPRKVVSQDELLDKVWPDTVVTPNTLQRSIAQLRKAFGDDRKSQSYIKTHAKQGYSLECELVWQDEQDKQGDSEPQVRADAPESEQMPLTEVAEESNLQRRAGRSNLVLAIAILTIICFGFIGYTLNSPKPDSQLVFGKLQKLTTTDNKEFSPTYSPDGQYIIFHRYLEELCLNRIWARNIQTQQEFLLTKDWGTYGGHTLSADGKKLVFISEQDCSQPVSQKICYDLVSVDFPTALTKPQSPKVLLRCQNSQIKKPVWIDDNNIAILQRFSHRWHLINYSIADNSSEILFEREDRNLVTFDYSKNEGLIAIITNHEDGRHYIELLQPNGQLVSSHPIDFPDEVPKYRSISANFSPVENQLIFSTGRQLFTLSYEGKVAKVDIPLDEPISSPKFHENGKQALLIQAQWDSDIASIPLEQASLAASLAEAKARSVYSSIARSTMGEYDGLYQPKGSLIAFKSTRSGEDQIWITDGQSLRQLTRFPMDTYIDGVNWAADGQSLLINVNKTLTQVFLSGSEHVFSLAHPVTNLFQWDSENNSVLASLRINGIIKFAEIDLNRLEIKAIKDKNIRWAEKSEDGRLIYTDDMNRFWQPGVVEDQLIEKLAGQGSDKRFVISNNLIYSINGDNQLWSYDLNSGDFTLIGEVHKDVDYLSDINQNNLLISFVISAKKEVAEIYLQD